MGENCAFGFKSLLVRRTSGPLYLLQLLFMALPVEIHNQLCPNQARGALWSQMKAKGDVSLANSYCQGPSLFSWVALGGYAVVQEAVWEEVCATKNSLTPESVKLALCIC